MMSEDPTPKAKRTKINASTVHAEFKAAKIQHPRTKAWIEGSVCNHCGDEIPGKTATNLKSHLRAHHGQVHDKVIRKIENLT